MNVIQVSTTERFWAKVKKTDICWTWKGSRNGDGYGHFFFNGRVMLAHRVVWTMANGAIPDGLQVLHKCDNPPCVRPDHLFLGTQLDNLADMEKKGRRDWSKGETCHDARLTEQQVIEIRDSSHPHDTQFCKMAAEKYKVTPSHIRAIITGKKWKYLIEDGSTLIPYLNTNHFGELNPSAKLTEQEVIQILSFLKQGISGKELAAKYMVTKTTISRIKTGGLWRHLTQRNNQ
jgi:hypothetical protein